MPLLTKPMRTLAVALSRLVLLVLAVVFSVLLFGLALLWLLWVLLKALLTGRKPALLSSFMQMRQASQQFRTASWSTFHGQGTEAKGSGAVIDGEASEIREDAAEQAAKARKTPLLGRDQRQ